MKSWCDGCGIMVECEHVCPPEGEHSEDGKWRVVVHTPDGFQYRSGASRAFGRSLVKRMVGPEVKYMRGPESWFVGVVVFAGLWQLLLWALAFLRWLLIP